MFSFPQASENNTALLIRITCNKEGLKKGYRKNHALGSMFRVQGPIRV
jgi:hypothetical protein